MKYKTTASPIHAILTERGSRYGKFSDHAHITQLLKSTAIAETERIHGVNSYMRRLSPAQRESLEMIFHKIGRILNGDPNYADSWIDIAGYAQLIADELTGGVHSGTETE